MKSVHLNRLLPWIVLLLFTANFASSVSGRIINADGTPLAGVNITIDGSGRGTTSNHFGFYSIDDMEPGSYQLTFHSLGYEREQAAIDMQKNQSIIQNVTLVESVLEIEAILVSAQKMEQQLQDVPLTMSVIRPDFLETNSDRNMDFISAYIPGLQVNSQSMNRPNYVIRGLTSDAFLASAQPRVSVFYDDISISRNTGALIEIYDMQRIEVLKGPQGTLFGRGAQIGALHFISQKPKPITEGMVKMGTGNSGRRFFEGMYNVPLSEHVSTRFAARYSGYDGFVQNTFGGDLNGKATAAFRNSIRYTNNKNTLVDFIFDYQQDSPGGTAFVSRIYPNREGESDIFTEKASLENGNELGLSREILSLNLNMHHYFNEKLDLSTILSFRNHQADELWDGDGSAAPALDFEENSKTDQFSVESRLGFDIGNRFSGFGGISYWREEVDQSVKFSPNEQSLFFLFTDPAGLVDQQGNPVLIPAIPQSPDFGQLAGLPLPENHVEESDQLAKNEAVEVFVDGKYRLHENFAITAGLRFVQDRLSLDAKNRYLGGDPSVLGLFTGNAPNVLFSPGEASEKNKTFNALLGRIVVDYAIGNESKAYMAYARGRRPNVIQVRADMQTEVLEDEKVDNFEFGIKAVLSPRLYTDAAFYVYYYNDFQTQTWISDRQTGEFQLIVEDGGKARAYGFESSIHYSVSEFLKINGTYAYIRTRFNDTDSDDNDQELAGNRFRLSPEHSWSLNLHFADTFMDNFKVSFIPSYTYKSTFYFDDANTDALKQEGFGLLNSNLSVLHRPSSLEIGVFAYNILDKEYLISAGNTGSLFGIPTFVSGLPLNYGINIKWMF